MAKIKIVIGQCLNENCSNKLYRKGQKYCSYKCMYECPVRNNSISITHRNHTDEQLELRNIKYELTMTKKYGVTHNSKIEQIKESKKLKSIEKYGVEYGFQSDIIKQKIKDTCINKYGVDNVSKSSIILNKKCNTFIDRYGEKYPYHIKQFYNKMRSSLGGQTKPEKYIEDMLIEYQIDYETEYKVQYQDNVKYYDFYLPKFNILIEYDGEYWHKNTLQECVTQKQIDNYHNDNLKNKIASCLGYRLVRIKGIHNLYNNWDLIH